jgi:phage-related protein
MEEIIALSKDIRLGTEADSCVELVDLLHLNPNIRMASLILLNELRKCDRDAYVKFVEHIESQVKEIIGGQD